MTVHSTVMAVMAVMAVKAAGLRREPLAGGLNPCDSVHTAAVQARGAGNLQAAARNMRRIAYVWAARDLLSAQRALQRG